MITCHRKFLEQRCLERGISLAEAMPCVVSMEGDMWTVDVHHPSYPAPTLAALSFKCVPDCTTPEFACAAGECCVENLDGSNGCQQFVDYGFKAFDGSNRYFRKMTIYDLDCCYLEYPPLGLAGGRKDTPGPSDPNDGYYVLRNRMPCAGGLLKCVVTESVRWYGEVLPAGTEVPQPIYGNTPYSVQVNLARWVPPGSSPRWRPFNLVQNQLSTATFMSIIENSNCCNGDGSKIYAELSEEIPPPTPPTLNWYSFTYDNGLSGPDQIIFSGQLSGTMTDGRLAVTAYRNLVYQGVAMDAFAMDAFGGYGGWLDSLSNQFDGLGSPALVTVDGWEMDLVMFDEYGTNYFTFGPSAFGSSPSLIFSNYLVDLVSPPSPDLLGDEQEFNVAGWSLSVVAVP